MSASTTNRRGLPRSPSVTFWIAECRRYHRLSGQVLNHSREHISPSVAIQRQSRSRHSSSTNAGSCPVARRPRHPLELHAIAPRRNMNTPSLPEKFADPSARRNQAQDRISLVRRGDSRPAGSRRVSYFPARVRPPEPLRDRHHLNVRRRRFQCQRWIPIPFTAGDGTLEGGSRQIPCRNHVYTPSNYLVSHSSTSHWFAEDIEDAPTLVAFAEGLRLKREFFMRWSSCFDHLKVQARVRIERWNENGGYSIPP